MPAEDESEELLLAGQHDLPAELQGQETASPQAEQDDNFYIKIEFNKVRLIWGWASWSEGLEGKELARTIPVPRAAETPALEVV